MTDSVPGEFSGGGFLTLGRTRAERYFMFKQDCILDDVLLDELFAQSNIYVVLVDSQNFRLARDWY